MGKKGNKNAKKEEKSLRIHRLNFRLNDEELKIFNHRKGVQNKTDFIVNCIINGEVKTVVIDQEKVIIKNKLSILRTELGRIGNNLNQLTKILNAEHKKGLLSTKMLSVESHLLELENALEKHKKVLTNLSEFS